VKTPIKSLADLRSRRWFAANATCAASRTASACQQMGLRREDVLERPIVAIINTWSDLSPCHAHLRERAEAIKRGVLLAGGMPFELPAMSLGEVMVKPTTMLYRNFLAMEVEELLRSPAGGRCGAAGRLRQDHAGHGDGRHQHGHPHHFLSRGAHAQ
jgi:dihydroxyacid dehydratase/phosphogluconate dehydratase